MAELRGKLSRGLSDVDSEKSKVNLEEAEDILTSNVFGFLKYANRRVYLGGFLRELELSLSDQELDDADFQFWPTYPDGTEPDVVIIIGLYYILIEAKKNANFGTGSGDQQNQLYREYNEGVKAASAEGKEFILLTVTADYSFKLSKFGKASEIVSLPCFRWISWQKFATNLNKVLEQHGTKAPNLLLATDLLALLERKNLREFRSFDNLIYSHQPVESIFFSFATAVFRGGFIGFDSALPKYTFSSRSTPIYFGQEKFKGFKGVGAIVNPVDDVIFYQEKEDNCYVAKDGRTDKERLRIR